ncbi:hypothetical protein BD410DRAFT_765420 [Rickenella mellea]|uniref:RING-type domain-containing protein n=1 Tax=Rickenella mellea TaxID=50990 RepID=A0A4Y7QEN8_9AGAM|nr:hypothetical protein BD410DRAFT_765420 [Rickenella mellea]
MPYCAHCNNIYFVSRDAFRQHVKNSRNHPWCRLCNRKFVDEAGYDDHMASAHTDNEHCETCDLSFINETALYKHYRDSRAHPTCPDCNEGFYSENSLRNHVAQFHSYQEHCILCQRQFVNRVSLEQHYLESSRHPSCDECSCGFTDDSAFDRHVAERHADYGYCVPCQRQFLNRAALAQHYHDSSRHPTCDYCNCGFVDDETLYNHTEMSHPNVHCEACHRSFVDEAACSQHFLKSPAHATYRCKFCDDVFHDDDDYDLHIESHLPEYCDLCERKFANKGAIYQHYFDSAQHPSCIFGCQCGLANESEYQTHLKSQHGTCGACKLVFASRSALQEHYLESSLHPTCHMCNQGFEDIERYTSHILHPHHAHGDSLDKHITGPSSGAAPFLLNLRTSGLVFTNIMDPKTLSAARGEDDESDCDVYGSELSTPRQAAQIPLPGDSPISNGECDEDVPSISDDETQATCHSTTTQDQMTEDFAQSTSQDHQPGNVSCSPTEDTSRSDTSAKPDTSSIVHLSSLQTGSSASALSQTGGGDTAPPTPTNGNDPASASPTPFVSIVISPPDPSDSSVTSPSTPDTPSDDVRDKQGSLATVCQEGRTVSDTEDHQDDAVKENPSEEGSRPPVESDGTEQNDDISTVTGNESGGEDASDNETERPEEERMTCENVNAISPSGDISGQVVKIVSENTSGVMGDAPNPRAWDIQEEDSTDAAESPGGGNEHPVENLSDQPFVTHDDPFEATGGEAMDNAESDNNSAADQLAIQAGNAEINEGTGDNTIPSEGHVKNSNHTDDIQSDSEFQGSTELVTNEGGESTGTGCSAEASSDQPRLAMITSGETPNTQAIPSSVSTDSLSDPPGSGGKSEATGDISQLARANLKDVSTAALLDCPTNNASDTELADETQLGVTPAVDASHGDSNREIDLIDLTTVLSSGDSVLVNGEDMTSAANIRREIAVHGDSTDDNTVTVDNDRVGSAPDEWLIDGRASGTSTSGVELAKKESNEHNNSMEDTKDETIHVDGGEQNEPKPNVTTPASNGGTSCRTADNKDTTHANGDVLHDGSSSLVGKGNDVTNEKSLDQSNDPWPVPEISNAILSWPSNEVAEGLDAQHSAVIVRTGAPANAINSQSSTYSNTEVIPDRSNAAPDAAARGKTSRRNRRNRRNKERKRRSWAAKSEHASNGHPSKEGSGFTTDRGDGARSDVTESQSDETRNHLTTHIPEVEMDSPFFAAINLPLPPHSPIESESSESESESVASSRLLELLQAAGIGGIGLPPSESSMTLNDMDDEEDGDEKYLTPSLASPEERYFTNIGPAYDDHDQLSFGDSTYAHALGDSGDSLLNSPVHTPLDPDAKDNVADMAPPSESQADSVCSTPSKLYCRICHADPCVDVTATFCGHIFCYGCITKHVMQESKCAVCSAPTLLYLLFKLDLSM